VSTKQKTRSRDAADTASRNGAGQRKLSLTITAADGKSFVPFIRTNVLAAHAMISPALAELSLALVGDERMERLHQQFMNLSGPTDVLTFPLEHDRRGAVTAGEIVVCVPEARRRAAEHAVSTRHELLLYALHGVLHLCGFDDRTDRGFRQMHRKEDEILTAIGVGPVFRLSTGSRKRGAR
jgi:probable rRNA maturation factor